MTGLPRRLAWIMAVACGLSVANLYYSQPLLVLLVQEFKVSEATIGLIPLLTQAGYALGMLFLVPLGDMLVRRRFIPALTLLLAGVLLGAAMAPTFPLLCLASLLIGLTTVIPQLLLPLAATLETPERRGKTLGFILGGVLLGILLARTVGGFVGGTFGWRVMDELAAGLMLVLAGVLAWVLPDTQPTFTGSYASLLRSIAALIPAQPLLRESSLIGGALFGSFCAFWATLAFFLAAPPYGYGSAVAGSFGLVGAAGALLAPQFGRISDRRGPTPVVGLAAAGVLLSFVPLALAPMGLPVLVLGILLLDTALQGGHVANMARIYSLVPGAQSRLNTVYMTAYFLGGAFGSSAGTWAWSVWRWPGVCALGAGLAAFAGLVYLNGRRGASAA